MLQEKSEHRIAYATINAIILILSILLPFWIFAWMACYAIAGKCLLAALISNILLVIVYKFGAGKKILIPCRALAVVCTLSVYLPTILLSGFSQTKIFYPIKKYLYTQGVYSGYSDDLLPEKLPSTCEDYLFITQEGAVAQDYHASSYLVFHTDTETLKAYETKVRGLGSMQCSENYHDEETAETQYSVPVPRDVYDRLLPEHMDNLDYAVTYTYSTYSYSRGCMLNYESGLVIFWT